MSVARDQSAEMKASQTHRGALLTSPHAHASIKRIDVRRARELPYIPERIKQATQLTQRT